MCVNHKEKCVKFEIVWGIGMKDKARKHVKIGIVVLIALLIITTIFISTNRVKNEMKAQLRQNLEDVSRQNAMALRNQIHNNHQLLNSLAFELIQNREDMEQDIVKYHDFVKQYGLKRLGICKPDGMTISTDGARVNLSHREFFQRGMEGKNTITGVLTDAMSEEHGKVTVMSEPIKDTSGNILGVTCLTYDSEKFNEALQIDCFEGHGYSLAINETGEIMVATGNDVLELSQNLYTDILENHKENTEVIQNLQESIKAGEDSYGMMWLAEQVYYYATPVILMDGDVTWYMFTVIPTRYFDYRFDQVEDALYFMEILVLLFILTGVFLLVVHFKRQQKETMRIAFQDPLTGGANFSKFCQVLDSKRGRSGYLISMDIQNFGNINIAAGRTAGDEMLKKIWNVIDKTLKGNEMLCRVREDSFALFIAEDSKEAVVGRMEEISHKIHELVKEIQIPGIYPYYGIYTIKENETVEDAYNKAKIARRFVSGDPSRHYIFYSEINHDELFENQRLEEGFEEAIANKEFEVWYQPKYSTSVEEIVGSEALVRWRDKDGSMISPGRFIPLFERNGMIARLDEYMFRNVCCQQVEWQKNGYDIMPVSVNLSRASLYYSDIAERYDSILKEYDLDPKYVEIEITESAMIGKSEILDVLRKFRNMGVHVSMDDFGTGYSSLAVLSMRCFDTLKLDKSLIDHIGEKNGETLLYHVVNMGQQLGLHITAEGVENRMQLRYLKQLRCDDIQGFLFARPMTENDFEKLLKRKTGF